MTPPAFIRGAEEYTAAEIRAAVAAGAALVRYPYVVSPLVVTLRYDSTVHLVRTADGRYARCIPYLLTTLLLGWWGVPWGPVASWRAIWSCLNGGDDVTAELLPQLDR